MPLSLRDPLTGVFLIEHPTRGVLRDHDAPEFRFSVTGQRGDPDSCELFYDVRQAERVRDLMPNTLRADCEIRRLVTVPRPEWRIVRPAPGRVTGRVRFLADDGAGLWNAGDEAYDLGWESPGVPVRVLMRDGELLTLTDPFKRALVESF